MSNDEIAAAKASIAEGDFAQARHHINNLAVSGLHPVEVEELKQLIAAKENAEVETSAQRIEWAIGFAVLGYALLSIRTPAEWGTQIWSCAFMAIPLFIGILCGNSVSHSQIAPEKAKRFWRSFAVTAVAAEIYVLIGMALARSKLHSADKSSDFFIFLVIPAVLAGISGLVSGIVGGILAMPRRSS